MLKYRPLRCLIISDQLIPGVAHHGACHDVYQMTKDHGSIYLESGFAGALPDGTFDLVLVSGHATAERITIRIDSAELRIAEHLSAIRSQIVYLNACDAGRNRGLLAECFTTLNAQWVVAPVAKVPWGREDNVATLSFVRCLLSGLDVDNALLSCNDIWSSGNPYRVFRQASDA